MSQVHAILNSSNLSLKNIIYIKIFLYFNLLMRNAELFLSEKAKYI
jgi:hypothetical protein